MSIVHPVRPVLINIFVKSLGVTIHSSVRQQHLLSYSAVSHYLNMSTYVSISISDSITGSVYNYPNLRNDLALTNQSNTISRVRASN